MPEDFQQDALDRINDWLKRLEDEAKKLIEKYNIEDLDSAQQASLAGKYIMLIARLLELRQQFTNEASSDEERLLKIILARE